MWQGPAPTGRTPPRTPTALAALIRTAPPQAGQALAAGCTFVSRGRLAGNGRRAGLALAPGAVAGFESPADASAGIGEASAASVSISSIASSSWAAAR